MRSTLSSSSSRTDIVEAWLSALWGHPYDLAAIDVLATEDVSLQCSSKLRYSGRLEIKQFIIALHRAFPDLKFRPTRDLVCDGDIVVTHWEACGIHTGPAFADFNLDPFPEASGRRLALVGLSATRLSGSMIAEDAIWPRPKPQRLHLVQGGRT